MTCSCEHKQLLSSLSDSVDGLNDVLYELRKCGYEISVNTTIVDVNDARAVRHPIIKISANFLSDKVDM
ncbi:hypothetical protein SAMN05444274_108139 [Mariniphaga anaerophila]|uniref:Uncharacterized protein n=1 Tax=Mariniphaga anaerophila TaxID=1484053 RepID=A0A1M5E9L8_9BACT|nr:hypothetical protein [Mariniphaga anaerophila]SHF75919.1 hypothetical protein SAMN05444274_108139 [Mariniphaga anaerophila]